MTRAETYGKKRKISVYALRFASKMFARSVAGSACAWRARSHLPRAVHFAVDARKATRQVTCHCRQHVTSALAAPACAAMLSRAVRLLRKTREVAAASVSVVPQLCPSHTSESKELSTSFDVRLSKLLSHSLRAHCCSSGELSLRLRFDNFYRYARSVENSFAAQRATTHTLFAVTSISGSGGCTVVC